MRKPSQFDGWPEALPITFGPYRAVVQHITDGDSCDVLVDCGFGIYHYIKVRIMAINAPELYRGTEEERARGKAAKEYLESMAPVGTQCVIRTDKDRTSFGRYSASILLADGTDVGSAMVDAGMAEWSSW